nr:PilZ domain-containing protein [Desulfobulbaceae bacterium]
MKHTQERRRNVRYKLGDSAIAVFGESPGHISDISVGGLSFIYLDSDRPSPESDSVDILDGQQSFFLEKIPCRTVVERLVVNESPYNLIKMVRRSLEFVGISDLHKNQIESYINSHSSSLA